MKPKEKPKPFYMGNPIYRKQPGWIYYISGHGLGG